MGFNPNLRIGVLGGGQLGRMMIQSAIDFNLNIHVLDPDPNAPCSQLTSNFQCGSITDFDSVYNFGQQCDLITIEIENVNIEALKKLESEGKMVFPQPHVIEIIKDKGIQKEFYESKGIPTSPFVLTKDKKELNDHLELLPAAHKLRTEGYDGRGVKILKGAADFDEAFDAPGVLEKFVDYDKEISVIVARNVHGEVKTYPPVELEFHPEQNLVEFLFSPSQISPEVEAKALSVAVQLIESLDMVGLLAVEMFATKDGEILVNESAPRTHNSGHHSIEANVTSQFEQHIRAILGLPLGDTSIVRNAVMINLLGAPDHQGVAKYTGVNEAMAIPDVHIHLYGKKMTKPFRKMGHVTILGEDMEQIKERARQIKSTLVINS